MAIMNVNTTKAPAAIGPYSQAIKAGGFVYVSGSLPIDMATGELFTGDIAEQTRFCFKNINAILEAAGTDLSKVVKTTVFLKDLANFARMNAAYAEFFPNIAPARSCVQIAALPKNADIEIEVIAEQ